MRISNYFKRISEILCEYPNFSKCELISEIRFFFSLKSVILRNWSEVLRNKVWNLRYPDTSSSPIKVSGFFSIFKKSLTVCIASDPSIRFPWNFSERFLRASSWKDFIIKKEINLIQDKDLILVVKLKQIKKIFLFTTYS